MIGAVLNEALVGVLAMSSRSAIGRRDASRRVAFLAAGVRADVHTFRDSDPRDAVNMAFLLAAERTHAVPHNFWLNDIASQNIESMVVTLDTSHFDMSTLNAGAFINMHCMLVTLETSHREMSVLNDDAPRNMPYMLFVRDTSQLPILPLKDVAIENMRRM